MQSGEFDRKITIQSKIYTKDTDGGDLYSWQNLVTLFAKYKPMTAKERFSSSEVRQVKEVVFTIRFRSDITADMRILYAGEYYRINGIAELGRRRYIQLTAEFLTGMAEAI